MTTQTSTVRTTYTTTTTTTVRDGLELCYQDAVAHGFTGRRQHWEATWQDDEWLARAVGEAWTALTYTDRCAAVREWARRYRTCNTPSELRQP